MLTRFLEGLRSRNLFLLAAAIFVVDLFLPDPVPFLDEALLGILSLALARWKKPPE